MTKRFSLCSRPVLAEALFGFSQDESQLVTNVIVFRKVQGLIKELMQSLISYTWKFDRMIVLSVDHRLDFPNHRDETKKVGERQRLVSDPYLCQAGR